MNKVNRTQYGILSLLSKKDMSGYDIKQMASKVAPFHWSESNAQIYPILKALEKEELVESHVDQKSGDRNRRIYAITTKGLDSLKSWLAEPTEPSSSREELLLKLTAGEHASIPQFIKQLETFRDHILHQQKTLAAIQNNIDSTHAEGLRKMYLQMTYDYAAFTLDAKLAWCDKSLQWLKEYKES
jgi:DNA-binding PadR family transcriptional regulator